jgi:hypothetical protein
VATFLSLVKHILRSAILKGGKVRQPVARLFKRIKISFFNRLRETAHLIPPELEGVNILVYTPEEFIEMKREGNAFAEMIMEEGIIIYDRQTEN